MATRAAVWVVAVIVFAITTVHATPAQDAELEKLQKEYNSYQPGRDTAAIVAVAKKLYALQVKVTGADSPLAQRYREWLARAHEDARQYPEAEQLELQIIAKITKDKGAQDKEVIEPLQRLAGIYSALQRMDEAETIWLRIVAAAKHGYGDQSAEHARYLNQYAWMLDARSEYSSAQRVYEQALKIYDALPKGSNDTSSLIGILQSLGQLYLRTNQHPKAVVAFDRAIELTLKSKDTKPMLNVNALWGTGTIYWNAGRKDLAKPLYTRASDMAKREIAALEKTSPTSADLVFMHQSLGFMYWFQGDLAQASAVYDKALEIVKKGKLSHGIEGVVAALRRAQGRNKDALALLEIMNKAMPMKGSFYDEMSAEVLSEMGEHARAKSLIRKYLDEVAKAYGKQATYAYGLGRAADIYAVAGDTKTAEQLLQEWLALAEKEIAMVLRTGTDADHAAYSAQNANVLDGAISFNMIFGPKSTIATRLALTTLLRRKGRILDASAGAMATIRKKLSPDDRKLLDALTVARAQLAKLSVAGAQGGDAAKHAQAIAALEETVQRLEGQISKKSSAYRAATQPVDLGPIQKLLPKDARLVEIANYEPRDPRRTNAQMTAKPHLARRYVAYIVASTGEPVVVDLGEAAPIEQAIVAFRKALADPDNDQAATLGNQLHALTTAKILPKLGGATNVLIAPDGALNVVPLSALVDDKKQFLIAKYTFTYLTSGRDLLRLSVKTKAKGGGVLFADPQFDATGSTSGGSSRGRRSASLSSLRWPQLPGTAAEADAIAKTYKGLDIKRGAAATEGAVKKVKSPLILHLATHGFFLPDDEPEAQASPAGGGMATPAPPVENPLLRSGLAFAGANKLVSGDDDGLLTALEASGLDLEGTKLVVLSACETGVGKVTNGDGVYGLRRALVIAGAESLVMSLWQVDDFATKELMAGFYTLIAEGKPRSAALRDTQIKLLSNPKYAHPFYWAAFVPAGATTPLKD